MNRNKQAGFTLIELLVVVSIIAVLAALSAGVYFRVRAAQQEKLTGEKILQLQKPFLQQWTAVLDTAKKEPIPPIVMTYAGNDPDRAKALWAYIHLRREFPESTAEAMGTQPSPSLPFGIYLRNPSTNQYELALPRNEKIWNMVQGSGGLPPDEQAAVCAYAFLTAVNRRGMESGIGDSMTSKVGDFTVFVDAFQKPITFRRLFYNTTEMDAKPYTAATVIGRRDPLDPLGKLNGIDYPSDLALAVGGNRMIPGTSANTFRFTGSNFIPTFISSGLNKKFDPVLPTTPALGLVYAPNGDDLYGYRLNVEGRTGN